MTDADYQALSDNYADPNAPLPQTMGEALTGADAAAVGRALMLRDFGSDKAIEEALRTGRPRVDGSRTSGHTVGVTARIPDNERDALMRLAQQTGRNKSDLIREGVQLLLERHQMSA